MILERFSLKGKTALVTGSSRGLGAAIALALAEARPGDCVLVAGKGHDDEQDDRQIAQEWLYQRDEGLGARD